MKHFVIYIALIIFTTTTACSGSSGDENANKDLTSYENQEESENSTVDETNKESTNPLEHTEYHPNGALKIKGMLNEAGNREGLWISYYDNGQKWSEMYYVDGQKDGHSITFYPNGEVRYIGEYKKDERIGTWKFYSEAGELTKQENF